MERHTTRKTPAPTLIRLGVRVLSGIGLAASVLSGFWLWQSWQNTRWAAQQVMTVSAALVAAHAQSQFNALASGLAQLAEDFDRSPTLSVVTRLERFRARYQYVSVVTLRHPDGRPLHTTIGASSAVSQCLSDDPIWREDFKASLKNDRLTVGRPYPCPLLSDWVLPLYYTVRRGGRVAYVMEVGMALAQQQALWADLAQVREAAIGLLREDGYLVSRLPHVPPQRIYRKQNLRGALYVASRSGAPAGTYSGVVADGSYRYGAYRRIADYQLIAFYSESRAVLAAAWWRQVRMPFYLILGSLLGAALLYAVLARRYATRMQAIGQHLASPQTAGTPLPGSGVREIDELVAALAESRERLREAARNRERLLLSAALAATYTVREPDGIVTAVNDVFLSLTGLRRDEVIGQPWRERLCNPDEDQPVLPGFESPPQVLRLKRADGSTLWVSVAEYRESIGEQVIRHGLAIDVTERERLLETVRLQSQRLATLWQLATGHGLCEEKRIGLMLRHAVETLGMEAALVMELEGKTLVARAVEDLLERFAPAQTFSVHDTLCQKTIATRASLFLSDLAADPVLAAHPTHTVLGVRTYVSLPILAGERLYGTLVFMRRLPTPQGFSEDDRNFLELLASWLGQVLLERSRRAELERLALTDSLTGLPNRRAAETRLAQELARARRADVPFAVAIADLDRFKLINDHYGHETGDEVLREVATKMLAHLREGDWVARWGGEEFLIFLHQSDGVAAAAVMERLRQCFHDQSITTPLGLLTLTVSIGISVWRPGEALADVLAEADGCLYEAKRAGRDRVVVSEATRRSALWKAGLLQQALREGRLVPAYQPMVDLATGETIADEAMARLVLPDGQVLPAQEFIEAAEGINLIHLVDQTVAEQALVRCAAGLRCGAVEPGFAHFINVSPQFLARRELVERLLERAQQHCTTLGMAFAGPKPIVFEITERQLLDDLQTLRRNVQPLLDFGFRLALDDFGSGYSSFLYLYTLPIHFIKIEGWMVRQMRGDPKARSLVANIVALGRDHDIVTIAEGVEDAETASLLRELGVNWAQGFHFGAPRLEAPPVAGLREGMN